MELSELKKHADDVGTLLAGNTRRGGNGREEPMRKSEHQVPDDDNPSDSQMTATEFMNTPIADLPPELQKSAAWMQDENDKLMLLATVMRCRPDQTDYYKKVRGRLRKDYNLQKQMDTATSGEGSQWVPNGYSSRLFELIQGKLGVASLVDPIQMPRSPFQYPTTTARPTIYKGAEQTGDEVTKTYSPTNPTTGNFTMTAVKIGARLALSEEFEEDSIVPVLPRMRENLTYHLARALDEIVLSGDTASPHQDNDITATTSHLKAWLGWRAHAIDLSGATMDLSTFTAAKIRQLISLMGEYGADEPNKNLVIVMGNKVHRRHLSNLADATRTPEDYGGGNVVMLRGEVARFDGIPVVTSPVFREDLNASGVRDSTTQTKAALLVVWKPAWVLGIIRAMRLRSWLSTLYDQTHLIADWRGVMATPWKSEKHTVYGYGIDVS